jgi:hypothetical protein
MKYAFMLFIAFGMAIISSLLTALGMAELFSAAGGLVLAIFILIDLGRFMLFNFVVDEWINLRKVKYFIVFILALLFVYSGIGIFAKLDSLMSIETKEAIVKMASLSKAEDNANIKQNRSEDLASIARKEYEEAMNWNKLDYNNCIKRANKDATRENNCNNTKRRLDKQASVALQESLNKADSVLSVSQEAIQEASENKSEISSVLLTICKVGQLECKSYDDFQLAISILIFLVIIGTDYLQIAIVLAVNTRKNKKKIEKEIVMNQIEQKTTEDFVSLNKMRNNRKKIKLNEEVSEKKETVPQQPVFNQHIENKEKNKNLEKRFSTSNAIDSQYYKF